LTAPIKDGTFDQTILSIGTAGAGYNAIGESTTKKIVGTSYDSVFFNYTDGDRYFVASWNTSTEAESYLLEIASGGFEEATSTALEGLTIKNVITGSNVCEDVNVDGTCTIGNAILTVVDLSANSSSLRWVNMSINTEGSFNRLYTVGGMEIFLPFLMNSTEEDISKGGIDLGNGSATTDWSTGENGHNNVTFAIYMTEPDKDGNLGKGGLFNVTAGLAGTDADSSITDIDTNTGEYEIGDTDNYEAYLHTALATKLVYDTGGTQDSVTITAHGDQVYADVFVAAPEATVSGTGGELGNVLVTDAELDSVKTKNLIVVGGSCVNAVAAELLGGKLCGADFTGKTSVGSGQFLIESFNSPYATGKIALLVAGYEKEDTQKATTYLLQETVPTTVGTILKKQTATFADVA